MVKAHEHLVIPDAWNDKAWVYSTANTSTYPDIHPTNRNRNPFYQLPEFNAGPAAFFLPFLKPQLLQPNDHCRIRNLLLQWKCCSSVIKTVKIRLGTWIWQAKKKKKKDKVDKRKQNLSFSPILWLSLALLLLTLLATLQQAHTH